MLEGREMFICSVTLDWNKMFGIAVAKIIGKLDYGGDFCSDILQISTSLAMCIVEIFRNGMQQYPTVGENSCGNI